MFFAVCRRANIGLSRVHILFLRLRLPAEGRKWLSLPVDPEEVAGEIICGINTVKVIRDKHGCVSGFTLDNYFMFSPELDRFLT